MIIAFIAVACFKLIIMIMDHDKIGPFTKFMLLCLIAFLLSLSSIYVANAFGHPPKGMN